MNAYGKEGVAVLSGQISLDILLAATTIGCGMDNGALKYV